MIFNPLHIITGVYYDKLCQKSLNICRIHEKKKLSIPLLYVHVCCVNGLLKGMYVFRL